MCVYIYIERGRLHLEGGRGADDPHVPVYGRDPLLTLSLSVSLSIYIYIYMYIYNIHIYMYIYMHITYMYI